MGLRLAVKRSFRYFMPTALLNPRRLVRGLYTPAFFFILGFEFGTPGANAARGEHFANPFVVAMLILAVVGWWAEVRKYKSREERVKLA